MNLPLQLVFSVAWYDQASTKIVNKLFIQHRRPSDQMIQDTYAEIARSLVNASTNPVACTIKGPRPQIMLQFG